MNSPPPRSAALVLVTPDGTVVGRLPAVPVGTPWWPEVEPVVATVHERYGIDVTILRLLEAEFDRPHGGRVTYLAEVAHPVSAEPWAGRLDGHPLRHSFARPGGPAADLAWAATVLSARGLRPAASPVQVRSWNLSSLWRLPLEGQTAWLKLVPPFFAHEGALLARLAGERVPTLLGHDGCRMLLAEIAGDDLYDAELPRLLAMVTLLVDLQRSWSRRVEELRALGLPDWRAPALGAAIADVIAGTADELAADDRATLREFLHGLPARFAAVAACGLPETLVHGDFHPGNFRGGGNALTLLDWGDSSIGHPLLDQPAFLSRIASESVPPIRAHWLQQWRAAVPGSDPAGAAVLLAPIAAARQAVIYRGFLDRIEPAEHPYHRHDPAEWLQRTAALARESRFRA